MNSTNITNKPETEALADVIRKLNSVETLEASDGDLLAVPEGRKLVDPRTITDQYLDNPRRKTGTVKLSELSSFIEYVKRCSDVNSVIFADSDTGLQAVFDFHEEQNGKPRHGQHRATYTFPFSDQWKAWDEADGEWFTQAEFAEFMENRILDVLDPGKAGKRAAAIEDSLGLNLASPSQLLTLSRGLRVRVQSAVKNVVNTQTGETTIHYSEEHKDEAGAPLNVPGLFVIGLPVFELGVIYEVPVRLFHRVASGSVAWKVHRQQPKLVLDHAFKEACDRVTSETGRALFRASWIG